MGVALTMARILVVDDEESILIYLRMLFEDHGHQVRTARDADEALGVLHRDVPDLLTLDIMMPKRSGISLYREIRRNGRFTDLPIVFISGFTQLFEVGSEKSFRALIPDPDVPLPDGFLEKPVDVDELLGLVDHLTNSRSGPRRLEKQA